MSDIEMSAIQMVVCYLDEHLNTGWESKWQSLSVEDPLGGFPKFIVKSIGCCKMYFNSGSSKQIAKIYNPSV